VIRDWWIRMPRMEIRSTTVRTPGDDGMRLAGLTEVGGSTNRVIPSSEALPLTPTAGILEGRVWDSPRSAPLSGATVFLSGTQHSTTSDQNGAFFFPDLPAGTFSLAFTHPRLDSLHVFPRGIDVVIQPGEVTTARLEIPGHPGADPVGCSDADLSSHPGAMSGFVRLDPSGDPATGAVIRVSWSTFEVRGGGTFVEQRHEATTETDASGRYLLCGVPTDATLTVQASFGSHKGRAVQIQADPDGLTEMNFEIGGGN